MQTTPEPSQGSESIGRRQAVLLCQVGPIVCALPLEHVSETLRPLPIESLRGTAPFIDGVSIIRGGPVPIVDLARLLGNATDEPRTRLVVVKIGDRTAAFSVEKVLGVRTLEPATVMQLPALLAGTTSDVVAAVGSLDARLLVVLETARVVPDSSWASL